ncbi:uncharacterized protein LOC109900259 isoform X1 [Oncorhynchus kisutch]|uniref:uncharacterized protein LOC109900259 isoform X1 n=1 Tax=Oncorhynchus kisutch TaxID=8019 RepID=UPI0012DE8C5E|nr:uncharacterized protein LOC109900259 isoform X1 [Oncorhynchus kisutch]
MDQKDTEMNEKGVTSSTSGVVVQVREKKGPLRAAIPYMPFPVAVLCLFLNTFVPGLGALLKYFGAPSGTGQDEKPSTSSATQASSEMISEPQDEEPSTSSATQVSSQMLSEPEDEDEDPFTSTSPQQDSSEMPVAASPPNSAAEDESLSTDPADRPSVLTDRILTQLVFRGPSEVPPKTSHN